MAAVLALDEPYRATVLLRFFEDLTAEEIAARERLPVDTVRTRLKRALAMLCPDRPYESALRLQLGLEDLRAVLELRPDSGGADEWQVDLCSPLSGTPLPGFQDLAAGADRRVRGLPLGPYRVRVQPRLLEDVESIPGSCAVDANELVTLIAGETRVEFAAQPAARIRVLFEGTEKSRRFESIHPGSAVIDPDQLEGAGAGRWDWLVGALLPSKGSFELWTMRPDGERLLRRGAGLQPAPGRTLELVVPAAPLRLRLALDGRAPIDRELAPVPGETLEIPVPLDETPPVR